MPRDGRRFAARPSRGPYPTERKASGPSRGPYPTERKASGPSRGPYPTERKAAGPSRGPFDATRSSTATRKGTTTQGRPTRRLIMLQYTARRLLSSIPVLFGILVVVFALSRLIPGDPCHAMLGERATEAVCAPWNHQMGFDRPITTQFAIYLGNVLRGDFGESIRFSRPVTIILAEIGRAHV